jgi:hypothetical protein
MQVGKNGKKIPLDPATELPHDCPMRDKPSQQQPYPKEEKKSFDEVAEQIRNDHGNETVYDSPPKPTPAPKQEYLDHTLKPHLKYKTITDPTPEGFDHKLNDFAQTHNIHYTQTHIAGSLYVAVVMYEELK